MQDRKNKCQDSAQAGTGAGVPGKIRRTLGDEDRKMILKYAQNYLDKEKNFGGLRV